MHGVDTDANQSMPFFNQTLPQVTVTMKSVQTVCLFGKETLSSDAWILNHTGPVDAWYLQMYVHT